VEDAAVRTRALDDQEPLPSAGSGQAVREHAELVRACGAAARRAPRHALVVAAEDDRRSACGRTAVLS
jgi:hypothetical protein